MLDLGNLTIEELERLRDACNRRLLDLRRTTHLSLPELLRLLEDVKVVLRDQGKEWHSLESWQWMDGAVRFWLNPKDRERYKSGWYTIDELIGWSRESGPTVYHEAFDEEHGDLLAVADGVPIHWLPRSTSTDDPPVNLGRTIINMG
jgi:hypothetical protein